MIRNTLTERGVSEVIGSILVFGLVVLLLTIVQTQAVPNANQDVEFQHSQQVQGDFARLSDAVTRSAVRGTSETVTLETGTSYPNRLVLFNPPAATGDLRTVNRSTVLLRNVSAVDEDVRDYVVRGVWDSEFRNTSHLRYQPNYNRYSGAPTTGLEYGIVYDRHAQQTLLERRASVVDGREINLQLLADGLGESGALTTSVEARPVSTGSDGVAVRGVKDFSFGSAYGNPGNVSIGIPTGLNESVWSGELLVDAIDDADGGANGAAPEAGDHCTIREDAFDGPVVSAGSFGGNGSPDNDRYVSDCVYVLRDSGPNYLLLKFEGDTTYDLRMSKVGFGARAEKPAPRYVVTERAFTSLRAGDDTEVTATVLDKYNNPVRGVELYATLQGPSPDAALRNATAAGTNVSVVTDANGRATVELEALNGFSSETVEFKGDFDGDGTMGTPTVFSGRSAENATVAVSPSGSPPFTLTNATLVADDAVNLTVRNDGYDRHVTDVQLSEVTVENRVRVVGEDDVSGVLVIDNVTSTTEVTNVVDGPDALAGMGVATAPAMAQAFSTAPEEGGPPVTAPSSVTTRTISSGETANVTLVFDGSLAAATNDGNFEAGDAARVRVTLTFDDGHRETYAVRVEAPEDDVR